MSANVETMVYVGEMPWHGLGVEVKEAMTSKEAIVMAGLDWKVVPRKIYDEFGRVIPNYMINMRDSDNKALGVVTNRYKIVQNDEAFEFTDKLLGGDDLEQTVKYVTAGSLDSGKRVWLLAKMEGTILAGENIDPYLVFTNAHDGTGAVRVAMTPIRVVCQNTLNLALDKASRHWSCAHKGNIEGKLEEARYTLRNAKMYMEALEEEFGELKLKTVTDEQVRAMTDKLVEVEFNNLYNRMLKNNKVTAVDFKERLKAQKIEDKINRKKNDIIRIYNDKADLRYTERSAFRFINAVSDYATHTDDHKNTKNYRENLFMRTVDGNSMIDTAYKIALAA